MIDQKWRTVFVLFGIAGLNYADRTAISSVFPLIRADLGLSDVALGAIGSLFLWSYAAASPLAGFLADRACRSRVVVWSLACWSLVTLATGFSHSVTFLLACRVLLGLAECAYLPAAIALIADHHEPDTRATAMSIHLAGLNLGMIGGGASAGYLGERFGWRMEFWVMGAAGLLLAMVAAAVLRDRGGPEKLALLRKTPRAGLEQVGRIFRFVTIDAIFVEGMLMSCGAWMFYNWLPLYFRETYGMGLAAAGFAGTAVFQLAAIVGTLGGGYVSDKSARGSVPRRLRLLGVSYMAAAPCLLVFVLRPGFAAIGTAVFAYALLSNFGSANEHPAMCDILPPEMRSTAIALMNTLSCLAGGLGVLLAGYLKHDWGLSAVFGGASGFAAAAAAIVFGAYALARRNSRRAAVTMHT